MNWKEQLRKLEQAKRWDEAIAFMQKHIEKHQSDKEAYIFMNYLLMNLLVEENDWDRNDKEKFEKYERLTKKYFDESYAKFSDDAEYLYYTGCTAVMSEWFFGIDDKEYMRMLKKAHELEPDNILYQEVCYKPSDKLTLAQKNKYVAYAKLIIQEDGPIQKELSTKGELGEYILSCLEYTAGKIMDLPFDWNWEEKLKKDNSN